MCDLRENLMINTKLVLKYLVNRNSKGFQTYQSAETINVDFYNYTGQYIPFYDLGYCSLMTFLQNIPDTLKVDGFTREVTASSVKSVDKTAPASYFPKANAPPCQCCHSMKPLYQACELPRTPLPYNNMDATESKNRIYRPIPIKNPNSINDSKTTISPGLLGCRTYGDGKCSSSDSLNNKQQSEMTASEETSTLLNDLDGGIIFDKPNGVSSISRESEKHDIFECKEHTKSDKDMNLKFTPLSYVESEANITPPPPYSEQDIAAGNEVMNDPEKLSKPSYYYGSGSTSSEEKILETTMENLAIPFMFSDEEDIIQTLDSRYTIEKYGARFETTAIENLMQASKYYEIYISEVNSPYKFWFQMADDNPNLVDEMQEELKIYYNSNYNTEEDKIKEAHITKGYACAALYAKNWHRAEFLEKPHDLTVKVFFVDFGTVDKVSINDVRYLLNSLCQTPKLCHRGTLDFVKPITNRWNIEATMFFQSMIQDAKLVAGVSEIDRKTNSVRLYLMDRKNNVNVNHKLVYDGHAYPEDPRTRYKPHVADAVPSFDALETGKLPSYDDVTASLERGYDVEQEFELTINEDIDCFIPQSMSDEEAFQRVENFKKEREKSKQLAKQRDASTFLQFFGRILNNPFLNGDLMKIEEKSTNPFFYM